MNVMTTAGPTEPNYHDPMEEVDTAIDVNNALDAMTPYEQILVYAHYYNDMSLREIAAIVGTSAPTVMWQLRQAIKNIRKKITE